jgi:SOS-response transcriptional repressor LexA
MSYKARMHATHDSPPNAKIGAALRLYRKAAAHTLQEISAVTGINHGNISKIENGKLGFSTTTLSKIASAIGVPISEVYRRAEIMQGISRYLDNTERGPALRGTVPLISWVQAGDWQTVIDNLQPGQGERIDTTYRPKRHTFALRVRGDSMEPKFPDGCIIIVEPDAPAEPGSYVIVRQNGDEATFKQLMHDGGRRYLKPLNPRYPILELLPDAAFCGVVKHIQMDV